MPFFNYYLKGKGSVDKIAEATIFFSGENAWKNFESWPPKKIVNKSIYLTEKNGLSFEQTKNINTFLKYTSLPDKPVPYTEDIHLNRTREYMTDDQRFASRRPDVLVFETESLTENLS